MRALVLAHRILGIVAGPLMVLWCLSGVVMMYVPYPRLNEAARVRALPAIVWKGCCLPGVGDSPLVEADTAVPPGARIERMGDRLVFRAGPSRVFDLATGTAVSGVREDEATEIAAAFAAGSRRADAAGSRRADAAGRGRPSPRGSATPRLLGVVESDTWTVSGIPVSERPLARYALDDDAGTEVYVSRASGRVSQVTTAHERFWSWLGAIPHWLYWVDLRKHAHLWSATVVCASLAGCLLTVSGIVVGVRRVGRAGDRRLSPYSGWHLWHHLAGLVFGLFALSWVASGLLSMNPWGLLEGASALVEQMRLRGPTVPASELRTAMNALAASPLAGGAQSVAYAPFAGRPYFVVEQEDGSRRRLDGIGLAAPLTSDDTARVVTALAAGAPVASTERLDTGDAYFFGRPGSPAQLPVVRVILRDAESTRYYVDPVSAEILEKVDGNARGYRWLHQGLHRLDFSAALRQRPAWDVLMLALLSGVLAVTATGVFLGLRSLLRPPKPAVHRPSFEVTS